MIGQAAPWNWGASEESLVARSGRTPELGHCPQPSHDVVPTGRHEGRRMGAPSPLPRRREDAPEQLQQDSRRHQHEEPVALERVQVGHLTGPMATRQEPTPVARR